MDKGNPIGRTVEEKVNTRGDAESQKKEWVCWTHDENTNQMKNWNHNRRFPRKTNDCTKSHLFNPVFERVPMCFRLRNQSHTQQGAVALWVLSCPGGIRTRVISDARKIAPPSNISVAMPTCIYLLHSHSQ